MVSQTMMPRSLTYSLSQCCSQTSPFFIQENKQELNYENWDDVFLENNVNIIFNNFLNSYLIIFNACVPTIKPLVSQKSKPLLTTGIRTSCVNKRNLYVNYRKRSYPNFKDY
jgi:hypothetical protein